MLAGLAAKGKTYMTGVNHWRRGYDMLEQKLNALGAKVDVGPVAFIPAAVVEQPTSCV